MKKNPKHKPLAPKVSLLPTLLVLLVNICINMGAYCVGYCKNRGKLCQAKADQHNKLLSACTVLKQPQLVPAWNTVQVPLVQQPAGQGLC